jgi:PAS domain-containing protein
MHDLERNETTVLGVVQDITAHQNDLRKHKENELLLRGVMDFATTAIALDRDGLYLHFNPYSEAAYGFSIDGARGKPAGDFYPPEVAQVLLGHDRAVVETKQVIKREQIVPTLNGGRLVLGDGRAALLFLSIRTFRGNCGEPSQLSHWSDGW